MHHDSSLRELLASTLRIAFAVSVVTLAFGCAPSAPAGTKPPPIGRYTAGEDELEGGDWGSNCTMPGVLDRAKADDFSAKLFARQGSVVIDPMQGTTNFDQSLYFDATTLPAGGGEVCSSDAACPSGGICICQRTMSGDCAAPGTCFARSIDDLLENLNDKFHKWAGPPRSKLTPQAAVARARRWDVDALGQQRADSDPYLDSQSLPIAYSMGRDSVSLLQAGVYLGVDPVHLTASLLLPFRTYLLSTVQVARVRTPQPNDPNHTSAVIINNLMIADGPQQVPLGARLSCPVAEGVFGVAMDPRDPTKVLGYYAFSGTVWPNTRPTRVVQNLPATLPMPAEAASLQSTYRKVAKPPPGVFGPSEVLPMVINAGSACLDSTTCGMSRLPGTGTVAACLVIAGDRVPGGMAADPTHVGPPNCALVADDQLSYNGVLDAQDHCGGCATSDDCVQAYGTGAVCYNSDARIGASSYRTCVIQVGCTPSRTFDYAPWTNRDLTALQVQITMESYTCHIPMEVLERSVRRYAPCGLDVMGYGVYWCTHSNALGTTDPSGYFSKSTGVQLREACGHDQSGL